MICTRRTSDWHRNAFTPLLLGYTSTCEIAVRNSDWLYRLFSHVKIKRINFYPIHTEIFAPKINEINFIPVRDCWLLIGRTVFVTSEKYRPTNHRPRTALCH